MPLIILEGLDRTGKSSVAEDFARQGYEVIHQSAPPKGQTADQFLEEQIQLVSSAAGKKLVLDRSYYGELVWPVIYGRESLLTSEGLEVLRELEDSVGVTRILMTDPDVEAHWMRCVANNEPLTRQQFVKAKALFSKMADEHGFMRKSLKTMLPDALPVEPLEETVVEKPVKEPTIAQTKEQVKLETANAINDVLSKRILKPKGPIYDQLENSIRVYLNTELGKIFGTKTSTDTAFTNEEVELLKFFCGKLKEGKK